MQSITKNPITISAANTVYNLLKSKAPANVQKELSLYENVCSKEHEIKSTKEIYDNVNSNKWKNKFRNIKW